MREYNMDEKLEKIFINFANSHEDTLVNMGFTKESFIDQANQWCETEEGKLEIQKFILQQEIEDLKSQISALNDEISNKQDAIDRKCDSIKEIDDELKNL